MKSSSQTGSQCATYTPANTVHVIIQLAKLTIIIPNARRERGKVISVGVLIYYIYIGIFVDKKKFELYFSDRFTFSNIRSRTSRRIYRLALPLLSPETLSSSNKSRIF